MAESASSIFAVTAPALTGVWIFDPINPDGTDRNFIHAEGRAETLDVKATEVELVGRVNPLVEYGRATLVGLRLTVFIPFGADHDGAVDYWRTVATNRRAICYRDNRKRLAFVALRSALSLVDGRVGTAIGVDLRRVDYAEAV